MVNSVGVSSLCLIVYGRIVNSALTFFFLLYFIIGLDILILGVTSQPKNRSSSAWEIILRILLWPVSLGLDMYHLLELFIKTRTFDRK